MNKNRDGTFSTESAVSAHTSRVYRAHPPEHIPLIPLFLTRLTKKTSPTSCLNCCQLPTQGCAKLDGVGAASAADNGGEGTNQKDGRQQQLPELGKGTENLPAHERTEFMEIGNRSRLAVGDGLEGEPSSSGNQHTDPPGQAAGEKEEVFGGCCAAASHHPCIPDWPSINEHSATTETIDADLDQ